MHNLKFSSLNLLKHFSRKIKWNGVQKIQTILNIIVYYIKYYLLNNIYKNALLKWIKPCEVLFGNFNFLNPNF